MGENDRTFEVNYSSKGIAKLRETVTEKLKEFMGDYTDDTLVEYVIVLLKNGRRKDEAKNELDVFLGDDSDAFVSWLWDHLGSNISLYVEQQDLHPVGEPITKSIVKQKEYSDATFKGHAKYQQKELVRDVDENEVRLSQNSVIHNTQDEVQRKDGGSKPSNSPWSTSRKKRRRSEERRPRKSEVSESTVSASRRLLQFAVRDAVSKPQPSKSMPERSAKRLRSVISTSTKDPSLEERPRRISRTSISTAIKAVAEAAEDVRKVRSSRSVFDRLGCGTNVADAISQRKEYGGVAEDVISDEDFAVQIGTFQSAYDPEKSSRLPYEGRPSIHDVMGPAHLGYDEDDGYDDGMYNREQETRETDGFGTYGGSLVESSQSFHYGAAENANGRLSRPHKDSYQPAVAPTASLRIASCIAARNNQYQEESDMRASDGPSYLQGSDVMENKSEEWSMKERRSSNVAINGNAKSDPSLQQPQKTHHATAGLANVAPPTEDADSRTVFISNVHFAATKDSLSRHFNKFGEILKVIILTDPATGLPKGSAFIEFMRKEAAELALSLDGTSFMSRILKIVKKSSGSPEAPTGTPLPNIARSSSFAIQKFGRVAFPRSVPSLYRGRGVVPPRPGTRSFQWKRESESTVTWSQASNNVTPPPLPNRSMTYVRSEPKANA